MLWGNNIDAQVALLDWNSLGKNKQKVVELLSTTKLEVIKI